ncbi:MAG: hypothetical protein WEE89_03475 [Gemmatimonadota bacterium]
MRAIARDFSPVPLIVSALLLAAPAAGQQAAPKLPEFLQKDVGLTAAEMAALQSAQPVTKVVTMPGGRDIAVFGIIAVDAPRSFLTARIKDFPQYLRVPTRSRFGIFDSPATLANTQAVSVTAADVKELRSCKPGDCTFKLPAAEMKQLREKSSGNDQAAAAAVSAYVQQRMIEIVQDYRARGDAAMMVYNDRGTVASSKALGELAATPRFLYQYVPEFQQYLDDYPRAKLDGVTDVVYWSSDELPSLRPILNITHLTVYSPPSLPNMTLVSSKGIYANHYFEAALDVLALVDREPATAGSYVMFLRRYRFDNLTAGFVSLRGRVTNEIRGFTKTDLLRVKKTYEDRYRAER